ncbi:hydrogenase expression/formation protein HypE [Rhodothermus profundi]|uniref:Hydrogenase expression/formation protein HypE n=1 Tax=Rhodothermus profundi TaxID=633813 RepID=A0A1M6RJV0_9BACT|nr:hydrogenase expression/formation protein HypE [Rhodothermus profundi]SHK32638.1 hydrogenase expression/formation protein HypE [Rhodothermus profundi]
MSGETDFMPTCPLPLQQYPQVLLAHGGGGRLMHQLIDAFAATFASAELNRRHDGATLRIGRERLAFTTDAFVVQPLFFPGGDIGRLAVCGTVNDLAMCGARPLYLSVSFILEEGLPMETLGRVVQSLQATAREASVQIVTGDTKVVDRGKGDGIFISMAGLGLIEHSQPIGPEAVRPGDVVLLSGDIGRHGIAIMAVREGLSFETTIESDCAPLTTPVLKLLKAGVELHCLRDLTRGGLAAALIEIAQASGLTIELDETAIPIRPEVQSACELLGLDPLYVANEGRFVAIVPEAEAARALAVLQTEPVSAGACLVGRVIQNGPVGFVTLRTSLGTTRVLDLFSGEQLPRIC